MNDRRVQKLRDVAETRQRGIVVILEDIHDPHNAAAILRTCDAFGIQNVWFIFEKEKRYNPKRIGKASSSSANKWLDLSVFGSTAAGIKALKQEGYHIMVTALTDTSVSLLDYSVSDEKIALVVGNEHDGVSETMLKGADTILKIPMWGFVQSLNVSVATAIVLWELTKQRKARGNGWALSAHEQKRLLASFLHTGKK